MGSALMSIRTDGTLWACGYNVTGGLGQNSVVNYSSPVQVGSESTWNTVDSYANPAALAIKTDNTLWAWGNNSHSGLGQNNTTQYSSPTQIPGTTWSTAKCGSTSGYAIKTNGTLWSWGQNQRGELGLNTKDDPSGSPRQIPGTTWVGVYPGLECALAIKTDGTLWGWGDGSYGQLGQNDRTERSSPIQIPGTWSSTDGKISQLGVYNFYAIKADGTLWTCGYNSQGQLGLNDTARRSSPTQVPGTNWNRVQNQGETVIATKTDGTLWGWGNDEQGQLGLNAVIKYSSPTQIPGTNWILEGVRLYDKNGAAKRQV